MLVWGREQLGTPGVQGALQDVPPLTLNRASWEVAARTAPRLPQAPPRPEAEGGAFCGVSRKSLVGGSGRGGPGASGQRLRKPNRGRGFHLRAGVAG